MLKHTSQWSPLCVYSTLYSRTQTKRNQQQFSLAPKIELTKTNMKAACATVMRFREAVIEDYKRIASLVLRYGMPLEPFEPWGNLWIKNPAYSASTPIGWVLERKGEIVGWFANIPLHYSLNGESLRAATPRCWVVEEGFRAYAALLLNAFLSQKNLDLALSTTANEKSSPLFAVLGGIPVPQQVKRETAFLIADYVGFSAAYLRWKKVAQVGVLKYPLAGALSVGNILLGSEFRGRTPERKRQFDCEYDTLWSELQRSVKVLIGRRDAAALNWHFGYALHSGTAWLFECRIGSRVIAYGVFLREDGDKTGLKRMVLADYQQAGDTESQLPQILKAALLQARRERIHMIEILSSRLEQSTLVQRLAPYKRVISDSSIMPHQYKASKNWEQVLAEEARWDLTIFDGDRSLFPKLDEQPLC